MYEKKINLELHLLGKNNIKQASLLNFSSISLYKAPPQ